MHKFFTRVMAVSLENAVIALGFLIAALCTYAAGVEKGWFR